MLNYHVLMESVLKDDTNNGKTLLLHSCCAPCSSYPLIYLSDYFKITVLYYNPNIYPYDEFERRKEEQIRFIGEIKTKYPIEFIGTDYNENDFYNAIKGLEAEKEGGCRCFECYKMRMEYAAKNAAGYDFFTTTLSISPHKNASFINQIGEELEKKYGVKYLHSDFKKNNGYKKSIDYSKTYNLYRQDYCGCKYSKR